MAGSDRWYFSKEVLANTPSRRCGIDADKELSYRQQAANLIQDMGQRLHVSQLCINTAIVYMHRFYTFHSFTKYHRNSISSCALFLAAKVEEQPRKLEHVIKVSHMCLHRENPPIDAKSEAYQEQAMELVFNENLMLQTLGFDIAVEHPHTSVVNCCQLVRASKDLAQTSYFMATNSLHLTTMCLQYKPTVVACVCIHLACKWSSWEIPRSSEGKDWFYYVDRTVTLELLERLTSEFLAILAKCPSRLKRKIMAGSGSSASAANASLNKSNDEKKSSSHIKEEFKPSIPPKSSSQPIETIGSTSPLLKKIKCEPSSQPSTQSSNKIPVAMSYAAYRERKERDSKTEQSLKSNQMVKSLPPAVTRESIPQRERPIGDKMTTKQQQINIDKQKQIEERNKLKTKNPDYLWDSSSRQQPSSKPISSSSHQRTQNNVTTEDFYDNLVNKPSNFNSIFSTDGEDSLEFKKDIATDLKMEFSDNSNLSNDALNLSSFPSDFINDSSDSKKSFNTSFSNNNNNNNRLQTSVDSKPTSFMSIFSSPITTLNPLITPTVPLKLENTTTSGIPMKYNTNDFQNMLSRLKPEPPPPMLSPLKSVVEVESIARPEKQSFPSHSSVATHLKSNMNSNQNFDSKLNTNLKSSKTPPKPRNAIPSKHSMGASLLSSPKDKEVIESLQNTNLDNNMNFDSSLVNNNNCNNNNNNVLNSNDLSHTFESMASVAVKQENIEKSLRVSEVPSVLSLNRMQTNSTSNPELDIKPNIDFITNAKTTTLHSSPTQKPTNNINTLPEQSSGAAKGVVVQNKEPKEKTHSEDKHSDKHHKHSHHSHKSSKHKDKHKHKHKDKDREKHKRKDKDRDRERERDREKPNDSKVDPSYKLSWSSPKDRNDVSNNANIAPIKLKISKKKLSVDSPDKDNDVPQNPLKLRIQLKDQKLTTNATDFETDSGSGRKRKSSPKSSKKEKISKYDIESNNKLKDEKKSSKSSRKSNDSKKNLISDERYLTQPINSFSHQMLNMGITQPVGGQPQGVPAPRPSKAHK